MNLSESAAAVADFIMPRRCLVCGRKLIRQEKSLCLECRAGLPLTYFWSESRNPMADRFNEKVSGSAARYEYAAALLNYGGESGYGSIPRSIKYGRRFDNADLFGRMLGEKLASAEHFRNVDTVIPVPLHWTRKWRRGYNQAELIARGVAVSLGAELDSHSLKRTRRTASQVSLQSDSSDPSRLRSANVEGAFKATAIPDARHILLVDDVLTTGSTISECYKALRKVCGPHVRISVATLAFAA